MVPVVGGYSETIPLSYDITAWEPDPATVSAEELLLVGTTRCIPAYPPEDDPLINEVETDPDVGDTDYTNEIGEALDDLYCATGAAPNRRKHARNGRTNRAAETVVDQKRRWAKVMDHHGAPGMASRFTFTEGSFKELRLQVLQGSSPTGPWGKGGMTFEGTNRDAKAKAPWKYHEFNRTWYARYRLYEYETCGAGPYSMYCYYEWKPHHWTGGIKRSTYTASEASFNSNYAERLNGSFSRTSGENNTFEAAVMIFGIGLAGNSGVETTSKMEWMAIDGCSGTRYLYGDSNDPAVSRIVNAACI